MIELLEKELESVFEKLGYSEFNRVSVSSRKELCDFQINTVFAIAKKEKKNPMEVGNLIVDEINKLEDFSDYFKKIEFCPPGFINIILSDAFISNLLNDYMKDNNFGIKPLSKGETVVIDYGGPNIAKPLHVGHLRPAVIGQSIYNILKGVGYKTIGDVHLGDIGLQMGQVILGLMEGGYKPEDINIDILQEIYPKYSALCKTDEAVAEKCREITRDLQSGNELYNSYFDVMYKVSLDDIKRLYKYLGVDFDYWYGEKDSYKYIPDLIDFLNSKGVLEEDDGAKIIRVDREDDKKVIPPLLIQGKSGAYLYDTSDIATVYQRMKDFNPKYILYVVDNRQSLHFEQLFRACEKSGLTPGVIFEHNKFGTINGPDGKPFKTRSGETLKLDNLIDEVKEKFISKKESNKDMKKEDIDKIVNAIIKYADMQNNRERDYIFDIDKFSDVNGKTGPYLLYTAVRIKKIIDGNKSDSDIISTEIYNETDRDLRMKLLEAPKEVYKAANERMPHYIADYLYDLCTVINNFYQNNNISNIDDKTKKDTWVNLLNYTYKLMEKLLGFLVIEIPDEM